MSIATFGDDASTFPITIDTGSPITAYDDGLGTRAGEETRVRLYAMAIGAAAPAPRAEWNKGFVFHTPLAAGVGVEGMTSTVRGVLGGDLLQRQAFALDYTNAQPAVRFIPTVLPCGCELARGCEAVFPFALEGGNQLLVLDEKNVYTLAPTRLSLDICLEPVMDPLSRDLPCVAPETPAQNPAAFPRLPGYTQRGAEVRMLVATGFPAIVITEGAYDRLRGAGAAARLTVTRYIQTSDLGSAGESGMGTAAKVATLGGGELSSMALVGREAYFGPCGELARSRRQRRSPPGRARAGEEGCLVREIVEPCASLAGAPRETCDDGSTDSPVAAIIEMTAPLEVLVVSDLAPVMTAINADVRSTRGISVEGILGGPWLERLHTTIDYPARRVITRCASDDGCVTYPRYVWPGTQRSYGGLGSPSNECSTESWCCEPSDMPPSGGRCTATGPIDGLCLSP